MATSGLGNLLVGEGLLSEHDRRTISETSGHGAAAFAKSVLALGLLDEDELAVFIADRTRLRVAHKDIAREIQGNAIGVLDTHLIMRLEVLPLQLQGETLTVAMPDPLDRDTLHQVEFFSGYHVKPVIATFTQIYQGLKRVDPKFAPKTSPLERFMVNHADTAARRLHLKELAISRRSGAPRPHQSTPKPSAHRPDHGAAPLEELGDLDVEALTPVTAATQNLDSAQAAQPDAHEANGAETDAGLEHLDGFDELEKAFADDENAPEVDSSPELTASEGTGTPATQGKTQDADDLGLEDLESSLEGSLGDLNAKDDDHATAPPFSADNGSDDAALVSALEDELLGDEVLAPNADEADENEPGAADAPVFAAPKTSEVPTDDATPLDDEALLADLTAESPVSAGALKTQVSSTAGASDATLGLNAKDSDELNAFGDGELETTVEKDRGLSAVQTHEDADFEPDVDLTADLPPDGPLLGIEDAATTGFDQQDRDFFAESPEIVEAVVEAPTAETHRNAAYANTQAADLIAPEPPGSEREQVAVARLGRALLDVSMAGSAEAAASKAARALASCGFLPGAFISVGQDAVATIEGTWETPAGYAAGPKTLPVKIEVNGAPWQPPTGATKAALSTVFPTLNDQAVVVAIKGASGRQLLMVAHDTLPSGPATKDTAQQLLSHLARRF